MVHLTEHQQTVCAGVIDAYEEAAHMANQIYTAYSMEQLNTLACLNESKQLSEKLMRSLDSEQKALEQNRQWYKNPFVIGPIGIGIGTILGLMIK